VFCCHKQRFLERRLEGCARRRRVIEQRGGRRGGEGRLVEVPNTAGELGGKKKSVDAKETSV